MTTVKRIKFFSLLICTIGLTIFLGSWDNITSIDTLIKIINKNNDLKANDAIYVHTDKPYYIAGENIWFKVYLRKASTLLSNQWSKGVYVELIDSEGDIIDEREIYAVGEHSDGDFKLKTDLPEGKYRLRAYTNWMRNFGDSSFFNQEIQIFQINPDSLRSLSLTSENQASNEQIANRKKKYDLQFFPESGKFINGFSTKMGIKLVNQNGYGESFSGKIYNNKNEFITTFKGNHLGIGSFFMIPSFGESYYAVLSTDTQYLNPKKYSLPKVSEKGTSLFVVNNNALFIKVISTDNALSKGGYLIASAAGKVLYSWRCPPNKKLIPIKLPLDDIRNGIVKLTLLNDQLQPIVERVSFHYQPQNISISLNKKEFKKREKVEIDLTLNNPDGTPLKGEASMAIIDKSLVDVSQKKNNIISQLMLSNEIKGNIENPSWYFDSFDNKKALSLDNLMLTQGYREISWIDNALDSISIDFIPEPGLSIRGKTSNFWNQKKSQQSEITMTSFDHNLIQESTITDNNGGFTFTGMVFFDTTNFFFQAKKYNSKKNKVTKNNSISISLFTMEPPLCLPIKEQKPQLLKGNSLAAFEKEILNIEKIDRAFNTKTIILDEIEIVDSSEPEEFTPSTKLHSNYRERYVTDSLIHAQGLTVWQFLQQEMRTSQVLRRSNSYTTGNNLDEDGDIVYDETSEIPVVLDGFQVDAEMLQNMMMTEVGFIDVLDMSEGMLYIPNASNGVIAIYTQQGGGGSYIVKGIDNIISPGFYTSRTFYQPKYDTPKDEHAKPDRRITLLWEPNIKFDDNGATKVSFYTDDKATSYQIEIEGITVNGKPFYQKQEFTNN